MPEDNQTPGPLNAPAEPPIVVSSYISAQHDSPAAAPQPGNNNKPGLFERVKSFVAVLKRHKKRTLLTAGIILIAGVALGVFLVQQNTGSSEDDQFTASLPVEYTKPQLNVDLKKKFTFNIGYELTELEGYTPLKGTDTAIEVYSDPGLTVKAEDALVLDHVNELVIIPFSEGVRSYDRTSNASVDLTSPGEWGYSDQYFIVQKLDPKTGNKLEKPLVTRFTVQKKVQKPEVSFKVDNQGVGHFTWNAIEKATKYYIVKMENSYISTKEAVATTIIGSTSKTSWSTAEQDESLQKSLARDPNGVASQNYEFKTFNYSEDDMRDAKNRVYANEQKLTKSTYGVIAAVDKDMSAYSVLDNSATINAQLPHAIAYNAASESKATTTAVSTFDAIPSYMPVTMNDGTTVSRPITLDLKNVTKGEIIHAIKENDGSYSNIQKGSTVKVPYSVGGTMFKGEYRIEDYSEATYRSELERIAIRNKEAQAKTGGSTAFAYSTQKQDLSEETVSHTAPTVAYKVNATNPLTAYLAANMIAGNRFIDVSKYLDDKTGNDVIDASNEAVSQNPYILGYEGVKFISSQKVLEVTYIVTSQEERVKEQKAIAAEVERVNGQIIVNGMTDEQKVHAINQYIISTAEYDYNASDSIATNTQSNFKHAWTPAGVLLDKKAVCGGYAITFRALADKAGLESVYVTGVANGGLHAWNKVKVDGVWKFIDTTWNDSDTHPNQFYLLTDAQANETRTQNNVFVIDILVGNYKTN